MIYDQVLFSKLNKFTGDEEIEARFGFYDKDFRSEISKSDYVRLIKYFESKKYPVEETCSIVTSKSDLRRIETIKEGEESELIFQKKKRILNEDLKDYGIRISVSREEETPEFTIDANTQRTRHRYTFYIDKKYKVDITEIMQVEFGVKSCGVSSNSNYEMEIELIDKNELKSFLDFVQKVYLIWKETHLLYNESDVRTLNYDIGKLINNEYYVENMNIKYVNKIYRSCLVTARSINKFDLCAKSLIDSKAAPYYVTYKADGFRKILIVHQTGLWIAYPPREYNLLYRLGDNVTIDRFINKFSNTVLDGELVDSYDHFSKYNFLVFDCLAFNNKNLFNLKYPARLKSIQELCNFFQKNDLLNIELKEMRIIDNAESFFPIINELLDKRTSLNYSDDGLIFTPSQTRYNPFSELKYKKSKDKPRISLENLPDVCKWKPPKDMTIDFIIEKTNDKKIKLYVTKEVNGKYIQVEFKGTRKYPLDVEMINHNHPLTNNLPSGSIVEYEIQFFDNYPYINPRKERKDKLSPNKESVALDIWNQIMEPITEDVIRGKNLKLVFYYHNRIKSDLLNQIKHGSKLIDIGSGFGGDLQKWNHLKMVIGVEPNFVNFCEFLKRKETSKIASSVYPVLARGQDYVLIENAVNEYNHGKNVDAITAMLSLSFFWENKISIESLVAKVTNRLNEGGKFLFLTIDGDILHQRFGQKHTILNYLESTFQIEDHIHSKDYGQEVTIHLESSKIVGYQSEYFVYLSFLNDALIKNGFRRDFYEVADKEKLLTDEQKKYSSLYVYASYTKIKNEKYLVSPELLVEEFLNNYKNLSDFILVIGLKLNIKINGKIIKYFDPIDEDNLDKFSQIPHLLICSDRFYQSDQFKKLNPEAYLKI